MNKETDFLIIGNALYVTVRTLLAREVPYKTILNGCTNFKKGKSSKWAFLIHEARGNSVDHVMIDYCSIPQNTICKHRLPSSMEGMVSELQKVTLPKQVIKPHIKIAELGMKYAYDNKWQIYAPRYSGSLFTEEEIMLYAKNHAVLEEILQTISRGEVKLNEIYDIYKNLDLKFQTDNVKSFYRKIGLVKLNGIQESLVHGSKGKNVARKLSKQHKYILFKMYKEGKNTYRVIHERANLHFLSIGYSPLSLSTIKAYLRLPEVQNRGDYFRKGKKYAEDHLIPFLPREHPKFSGDLWEIDTTKAQFMYRDHNGKIGFLCICFVMDVHSRKIVGFSVDEKENWRMIIGAFQRAVDRAGHIAAEIVHDNFSAYKTEEFVKLKKRSQFLGVRWRSIRVGNSKDNGHVERLCGTFQTVVCKAENGYIGEGIRSKRKDAFPSPELLDSYRKEENLRDKNGLIMLLDELVQRYNNTILDEVSCPNKKFEESNKKNAIVLAQHDFARLFWKEKMTTVENSMVFKTIRKKDYSYTNWIEGFGNKFNGQKILTRFDVDEPKLIFLYDPQTDEFLGSADRDDNLPTAYANRTKEDEEKIGDFVKKKKKYIETSFYPTKEEVMMDEEFKKFDYAMISPSTSRKQILDAAERNYTLNSFNVEENKIKKIKHRNSFEKLNEDEEMEEDYIPFITNSLYAKKGSLKIIRQYGS